MLKVSAFYLEEQKSFIPKKIFFRPLSISKQKALFIDPIFSEGFEEPKNGQTFPNLPFSFVDLEYSEYYP